MSQPISSALMQSPLFRGIDPDFFPSMLRRLQADVRSYPKGSWIFLAGDPAERVGVVLDGDVQVVRENPTGSRTVLAPLTQGDFFGETFACAQMDLLPVSVLAITDCRILLLDYRNAIRKSDASDGFSHLLIENMLGILANKNLWLNRRVQILSAGAIRKRLLCYLGMIAAETGHRQFDIPLSRQALADFLAVDRSALSRELGDMQREGLLRYRQNHFELLCDRSVIDL